jgi:beta-mannosidase
VLQADGMKIAMEAHRAAMPYCMGSLYWQLNDCWPAVSWSSVDFYGRWKAFHYLTKKAYQPLIIVPLVKNNQLSVKVVSDSKLPVKAKVVVKTLTFSGDVRFNKELNVELPANTSTQVLNIDKEQLNVNNMERSSVIYVELLTPDGIRLADNAWYFKRYKELEMPVADVKHSIKQVSNNKFEIKLETNALAKAVYIKIDADEFKLSDNFFDMMPESVKTVELTGAFTMESLKSKLTVHTLTENFE